MKTNVKEKQMKQHLKNVRISPQAAEAIRKGPSPEAIKLLKAFLMRTSVPRIMAQRIRDREDIG
ncbi:hypothetical protein COD67_01045 [Bacillus cereus]|nr:hypothetical protein COI89_00355 [Bacillus cereus]PGU70934.1 hypothetical protein COD67_01045 [Bacillus cereus]